MSTDLDAETKNITNEPTIPMEVDDAKANVGGDDGIDLPSKEQEEPAVGTGGSNDIEAVQWAYRYIPNKKMSQDVYSFIAFGRIMEATLLAVLVVVFQILFLVFLSIGVRNTEHNRMCFPTDIQPEVRASQVLSLLYYVMFPGPTIQDIISAIETFPFHCSGPGSIGRLYLAPCLKLSLGVAAVMATFFLVLTSTSTLDVILNFAAVNFISEMDDDVFFLAIKGFFGPRMEDEAMRISNTYLPHAIAKRTTICSLQPYLIAQILVFLTFIVTALSVFLSQPEGCGLTAGND